MEMKLRYYSSLKDADNITWRIEIWQEPGDWCADGLWPAEGEHVDLEGSNPLVVEWPGTAKEEPVKGSMATLTLFSDSDRKFIDLYTIKPATVVLRIYRWQFLWWCGTLDPELYEEPYSVGHDYGVTLTFSDFGLLSRLNYTMTGIRTLGEIIDNAMTRAGLPYNRAPLTQKWRSLYLDTSMVTLADTYNGIFSVDNLTISSANFVDEDNEPSSVRDALAGMLLPLGLSMRQRDGRIWLFDLHGLARTTDPVVIRWCSDNQKLGVDKVANKLNVNFSAYADAKLLEGKVESDSVSGGTQTLVYTGDSNDTGRTDGFSIHISGNGKAKGFSIGSSANYYRILPAWSGSEDSGVITCCRPAATIYGGVPADNYNEKDRNWSGIQPETVLATTPVFLRYCNNINYRLKVSLDVMFDVRYNPFEQAALHNEEGNWSKLQNWVNFAYIPVKLELLTSPDGGVIYHYNNLGKMLSEGYTDVGCNPAPGWQVGAAPWGDMWLAYYDHTNRKSASGLGGWQTNKMMIGYYRDDLPQLFTRISDGDVIAPPPIAGYLRLTVGTGIHWFDYGRQGNINGNRPILNYCRWMMYRSPLIEVVNANGTDLTIDDVVYSGELNPDAKDDLSLSTICGSYERSLPTARGVILNSYGNPVTRLYRAGQTGSPEKLLINSLFSQYASRHATLSGSAFADYDSMPVYTDVSQPAGNRFMVAEERIAILEATAEVNIVEVSQDIYAPFNN